jgi:hypothetical protein
MKRKDNLGAQRTNRMMREWGILALLMIALHVLYFGGWIILDPSPTQSLVPVLLLTAFYLIGLTALMVVFFRRFSRAHTPVEVREARASGLPATAKVLEIAPTGWTSGSTRSASLSLTITFRPFAIRPRRRSREYQMRLLISRPDAPDYEAQAAEYLVTEQTPQQGDTIPVKIHPQRPEVVVLALDDTSHG